jgi:hypothetical protein
MVQYGIRGGLERSMWLKYKGNVAIQWTRTDLATQFPWINHSHIAEFETYADALFPAREYLTKPTILMLNVNKVMYGYKKSDLDMEYFESTPATEYGGTDTTGGGSNESKEAWRMGNTFTISGSMESDLWRDEQPFTDSGTGFGKGTYYPAYSLMQKFIIAQEMAKKSGVQTTDDPLTHGSRFTNPLTLSINTGYTYWNFSNFLKYLMDVEGLAYKPARKEIQEKWMPGYRGTWNTSTNLTNDVLLNGEMSGSSQIWNGRLPAERSQITYSNCVIDDLRIVEDASMPNRMNYEMRVLFDTHWERWGMDSDTSANTYIRFQDGDVSNRGPIFSTQFEKIKPVSMVETVPTSYIGPNASDWS